MIRRITHDGPVGKRDTNTRVVINPTNKKSKCFTMRTSGLWACLGAYWSSSERSVSTLDSSLILISLSSFPTSVEEELSVRSADSIQCGTFDSVGEICVGGEITGGTSNCSCSGFVTAIFPFSTGNKMCTLAT